MSEHLAALHVGRHWGKQGCTLFCFPSWALLNNTIRLILERKSFYFFFFSRMCCRIFYSYNLMTLILSQKSGPLLFYDSRNLSKLEGHIVHTTLFYFVRNINLSVFSRPQVQRRHSYEEGVVLRGFFCLQRNEICAYILYCS